MSTRSTARGMLWSTGRELWTVLFFLAQATANAAPEPMAAEYRQTIWTREQGLPHNTIRALIQTRDGYLWLGTQAGLVRFDGHSFMILDHLVSSNFVSEECTALAEDRDGSIWVGTRDGLLHFINGSFIRYTTADGLYDCAIRVLCSDRKGVTWIGTEQGLNRYHRGKIDRVPHPPLLKKEKSTLALLEDDSGTVWRGTASGLQAWNHEKRFFEDVDFYVPEKGRVARCLANGPGGDLWVASAMTLYRGRRDSWHMLTSPAETPGFQATCLLVDSPDNILLGTEDWGLCRFVEGRVRSYAKLKQFPDSRVNCLWKDREGHIWIGTENAGLVRWQRPRLTVYTTEHGLPDNAIRSLVKSDLGLWVGTDNGVSLIRPEEPQGAWLARANLPVTSDPGLPTANASLRIGFGESDDLSARTVRALCEDREHRLWIGSELGLDCWQNGKLRRFNVPGRSFDRAVRVIQEDSRGVIWLGSHHGLFYVREEEIVPPCAQEDLFQNEPRALWEDRRGQLWIGTAAGGLYCWADFQTFSFEEEARVKASGNPRKLMRFSTQEGLCDNYVGVVYEDGDGVIWVGTRRGLNYFQNGRMATCTKAQGLAFHVVNQILDDDLGNLWIGSDQGLGRIQKKELRNLAAGRTDRVQCFVYDEIDGLLNREVNGGKSQRSAVKLPDGRLCFGTMKGLAVIDPGQVIGQDVGPPVLIERVRAVDQVLYDNLKVGQPDPFSPFRVNDPSALSMRKSEQSDRVPDQDANKLFLAPGLGRLLEVQFTSPTFAAPELVQFRYKLEGLDTEWVEAGTSRKAIYTNLKPGAHLFRVMAANHNGVWNETGANFGLYVAPHLWQKWPFKIAGGIGLSGLLLGALSWRTRQIRRVQEKESATALARERERIARDMHDDIGARLTQIALLSDLSREQESDETGPRHTLSSLARETVQTLDAIVWAAEPSKDTIEELVTYLGNFAQDYLAPTGLRLRIVCPRKLPDGPVPPQTRHHIYLVIKEALANTIRHARASEVFLEMSVTNGVIAVKIGDNGQGFDLESIESSGHGLSNMKQRMAQIGGEFCHQTEPGKGTMVRIKINISGMASP